MAIGNLCSPTQIFKSDVDQFKPKTVIPNFLVQLEWTGAEHTTPKRLFHKMTLRGAKPETYFHIRHDPLAGGKHIFTNTPVLAGLLCGCMLHVYIILYRNYSWEYPCTTCTTEKTRYCLLVKCCTLMHSLALLFYWMQHNNGLYTLYTQLKLSNQCRTLAHWI